MRKIGKIILAVILVLLMLPVMGMIWVKDSRQAPKYCASCHEDPYYSTWTSADHLVSTHAQAGLSCQTCHDRTLKESINEVMTYVRDGMSVSIDSLKVDDSFCLDCHIKGTPHESKDAVLVSTTGREAELVVNPHDPYHDPFDCRDCHFMHQPEPSNICMECHKPGVKLEDMPKY